MGCRFKKWIAVLALFALLALGVASASTAPKVEWEKKFGGSGKDGAFAVQQTRDGGYIVAGWYDTEGPNNWDIWIIKLDANGNIKWEKKFGGSGKDEAFAVQQTRDGGYIVAGWYDEGIELYWDIWIIKLDANGNIKWEKKFDGYGLFYTEMAKANNMQQTSDGGYIVAGWYAGVIKLDANGNIKWEKKFGGYGLDEAYAVQQTRDGGYIVAGVYDTEGPNLYDAWVIKLDANGNMVWEKKFGGCPNPYWTIPCRFAVQQTRDGGYIVAGTYKNNKWNWDAWVIKLKGEGGSVVTPKPTLTSTQTQTSIQTPVETPKQEKTVTETPTPTETVTPISTTTTEIPEKKGGSLGIPGFEVISAIIAIAYVITRIRKPK